MCITYVTSDYREAETSYKVTTNAKPLSSNKEVHSIFRIYASNMSIPWLNKKESCKSFKAELAY